MPNLEALFNEATDRAASELGHLALDTIHALGISKTHSDLLGSHTVVTYPPLDAVGQVDGKRLFAEVRFQPSVDAYVHIPFCEYPCKFCPYTTLSINGKDAEEMQSYTGALKAEIATWAKKLKTQKAQVRSLFVGGGTPFAIPTEQLEDILVYAQAELPFSEHPEICVETSPRASLQADAREKLDMLMQAGVTRMSMGVQSFDFESLRDMARTFSGHGIDDEEKAVRVLLASGVPNVNIDMIQDLPLRSKGYLERLKEDLFKIAELKPQHVTWYNMRLRPETAYARQDMKMVTEKQSLHTRLTIWNFMEAIGYQVLEGDRFALTEAYEDRFRKTRGSVDTDLLGMGVSAYSHVHPGFFLNSRVIGGTVRSDSKKATNEYIRAVTENEHAIAYGFPLTDDELLAGKFALGLKKGVSLDEVHVFLASSPECRAYNKDVLKPSTALIDAGLLEVTDGKVRFTRTGRLFENEICARFYSPRVIFRAHERRGTLTEKIEQQYNSYRVAQELELHVAEQRSQLSL